MNLYQKLQKTEAELQDKREQLIEMAKNQDELDEMIELAQQIKNLKEMKGELEMEMDYQENDLTHEQAIGREV